MEVVAQQPWGQFTEEENGGGGEELLTRESKKRQLHHAHGSSNGNRNGNGAHHANGGEEEEHANGGEQEEGEEVKVDPEEEEQQQHKSISSDPAKGLWKCRHCDWTYRLASPCENVVVNHQGYHHQIERNPKSLVQKELFCGSLNREGKGLEAHENGNAHETNHGSSNGKLENGSHSNGSHQVPDGAEPKINKTEIYPTEDDKVEHVTGTQPKVEEYDLKKILDEQETHDLQCPYCRKFITRRVILTKRKRTGTPDEPSKRHVPSPVPGGGEPESPDVFRCLSCFSFFIPTGCSFNIFRIFGRRDADGQLVLPPASEDTPPQSENCTSWLLSCFQPGDSPNQPAPSDPATVPLLPSQDTVVKPEQLPVESPSGNQPGSDLVTTPLQCNTQSTNGTTTTTENSESYLREIHNIVVKQGQLAVESSSDHRWMTNTTITEETATIHTSFSTDTREVITGQMSPTKPAGGAIMDENHNLLGPEDVHKTATTALENGVTTHVSYKSKVKVGGLTNITSGDIHSPHVAVAVPEDVNQPAPRPQQRDDWDILKAIVYGGLVESVTSLSVVSAAASSGAKTLDIFILGIANLIGGLPLILHNIADLRDIRDVDGEDEQVGHYWLQLGRRSKARLHMVMALLSYMVFGLLPPVLYGLSFRESNNRENKMLAVAGASLAFIALLALGKAHVNRRPRTYFKTLMYYLTMAVSSSGLSYVASVLITRLLVQYGIIEQGGSAAPAPPGLSSPFAYAAGAETSAWASF